MGLIQLPSYFNGAYTPQKPENCCCGSPSGVTVNVGNMEPPVVSQILTDNGFVARRIDDAQQLIDASNSAPRQFFQGV